jgi:hypothetical protein
MSCKESKTTVNPEEKFVLLRDLPFSDFEKYNKYIWVSTVHTYITEIVGNQNTSLGLYVNANETKPVFSIRADLNASQFNKLIFAYDLSKVSNIATGIDKINLNITLSKDKKLLSLSKRLHMYLVTLLKKRLDNRLKAEYKKYIKSDKKNPIFMDTLENIVGSIEDIITFILDAFSNNTNKSNTNKSNTNKSSMIGSITVTSMDAGVGGTSCLSKNCKRSACCSTPKSPFCTRGGNTCRGSVCGKCCCQCIAAIGDSLYCGCGTLFANGCDRCTSKYAFNSKCDNSRKFKCSTNSLRN